MLGGLGALVRLLDVLEVRVGIVAERATPGQDDEGTPAQRALPAGDPAPAEAHAITVRDVTDERPRSRRRARGKARRSAR